MTTITFTDGSIKKLSSSVYLNDISDTIFTPDDLWRLSTIKSIMPDMSIPYKDRPKAPIPVQTQLMKSLQTKGYVWDKKHSTSAACVILKRADGDFWLFGMEGEIMHNPEALLTIQL
jgi:hypothetical protein